MFALNDTNRSLCEMLTYRRPDRSKAERKFIRRFLEPLGVKIDGHGNLTIRIGDSPIAWCSHTDTVHKNGGRQKVYITKDDLLFAPKSDCLGADDTAGVWLMTEMIKAQVPGLYIFHRGEETGARGSRAIAKTDFLDGIKAAIAFDRMGYNEVITHQSCGRCCSDDFAKSLASLLGDKYKPSDRGLFTDTANYTDVVGECTNISVGYNGQHTSRETLDATFIENLRYRLINLDQTKLVYNREPGEEDKDDLFFGQKDWSDYGSPYGFVDYGRRRKYHQERGVVDLTKIDLEDDDDNRRNQYTLYALIREYPEEVADFLEHMGFNAVDLIDHIDQTR